MPIFQLPTTCHKHRVSPPLQRPKWSLQRSPLVVPIRWRACRLLARRCCGGRPRKLEVLLHRKRLVSRCLADNLSVPSGASTTCRSAGGRRRSAAGSRSKWTLLPPAAGEPAAPLPSPSLRLGPHGIWFQLAPHRPSAVSSPGLCVPHPPRAFLVPLLHPETSPTLITPLPVAQVGDLCGAFGASWATHTSTTASPWRMHGLDNRLPPPGDRNPTLKHPPAPF